MYRSRFLMMLGMLCLVGGCSSENQTGKTAFDGPAEAGKGENPISVDISRTSMQGRWQLTFYAGQSAEALPSPIPIALIEVSGKDGSFTATVEETAPQGPKLIINESEIADGKVHLVLSAGGSVLDFVGMGDTKRIRGNMEFDRTASVPADLIATDAMTLQDPPPMPGQDAFEEAISNRDQIAAYRKFAADHQSSPLAMEALERALGHPELDSLSREEVQKLLAEYRESAIAWGPRMELISGLNAGMALIEARAHLDLARESIKALQDSLDDDASPQLRAISDTALKRISLTENQLMVESGDSAQQQMGITGLKELLQENPFDAGMLYTLATYARDHEQTDEAIEQFARLVAVPELERTLFQQWNMEGEQRDLPGQELARLWLEKHGDTEKLDDYVNQIYRDYTFRFVPDDFEAPAPGDRKVLIELFTGALCPPCVAADLATGAVEQRFDAGHVTVLRYHQHIPGPDPLTNPDGEARFSFYAGQGTPTTLVNGQKVDAGGPQIYAAPSFANVASAIRSEFAKEATVQVELTASVTDGVLQIDARVPGADTLPEKVRLRLAVAEKEIVFPAPNGIRVHEMIVRSMPGGSAGVSATDGQLESSQTVNLAELKQQLESYLGEYEKGRQFEFPIKPLDLHELEVIALIQNDSTREILGFARTSVAGLPLEKPEPPAADSEPQDKPEAGVEEKDADKVESPASSDNSAPNPPAAESRSPEEAAQTPAKQNEPLTPEPSVQP